MSSSTTIAWFLTFFLAYAVGPVALTWGWVTWSTQRLRIWTISSTLSLIGFAFSSASALLGLWTIVYASGGGF